MRDAIRPVRRYRGARRIAAHPLRRRSRRRLFLLGQGHRGSLAPAGHSHRSGGSDPHRLGSRGGGRHRVGRAGSRHRSFSPDAARAAGAREDPGLPRLGRCQTAQDRSHAWRDRRGRGGRRRSGGLRGGRSVRIALGRRCDPHRGGAHAAARNSRSRARRGCGQTPREPGRQGDDLQSRGALRTR